MGGSLGVESEVDVRSTFWFELRLAKQANLVTKLPYGDELTGLRVLIVDDNETNRLILREQLGSWGMHTDEAADAKGALGLLRSASSKADAYDVVVLDLNMPGMDGLQLAHAINVDSQIARPTMFMLSSSGRVARDDAATAGLAGTLTKPVRQSELFNCLMGGLSTHRVVVDDVPPQPAAEARARGHVLLVEDNAMNQLVARKLLTKLGYTVDVSRNGVEALEALEGDARYVAVLMDCQMPVMDGYAATREIRRREGGTRHTPIIAMTAAAMEGDREACLDAGMDDYLTKPIRPDAVARTLAQWIPSGDPADATAAPPTEAPDDDAAALDADRIAMLRELDDGDGMLLASIVDEFVAGAQRNLDDLREAVAEGDPEAVERAAHALKGASANLGATQLADLSGHLEALGRARALGGAAPAVEDIEREFERVRAALARVLTVR